MEANKEQVTAIKGTMLPQFCSRRREVTDKKEAVAESIRATFKQLREALDDRETELIVKLGEIACSKMSEIDSQEKHIVNILNQLSSCLQVMENSDGVYATDRRNVLMMKANLLKQVCELTTLFKPVILGPNTEANMVFSADTPSIWQPLSNADAVSWKFWQVYTPNSPNPLQCRITGKGTQVAMTGEKSTVILHVVNYRGEECEKFIEPLECKVVSRLTGTNMDCVVSRRELSQFDITYHPTIKGRHQLHIKVDGQHIKGSPFNIAVRSPIMKMDSPVMTIEGVKMPWGVAVNQRDEIVVTECEQHCVSLFNASGVKLQSFGKYGSSEGQFQYPRGIAVDSDGNMYVTDSGNNRVQKFTAEGNFIVSLGKKGHEPLQFCNPTGISFNSTNNRVYVVDTSNNRVQVLNSDLTLYSTFGEKGTSEGRFNEPCGIACERTGLVLIADSNNHRIQVFTAEGTFQSTFGRCGTGGDWPYGIAVDSHDDTVYVSKGSNQRVSVFNAKGECVRIVGKGGREPGHFQCPRGLVVDSSGVLHVCDTDNNRVQVF
jgi:tripartite motif-containing protein 2/3/tripartite motif-containing protein 71